MLHVLGYLAFFVHGVVYLVAGFFLFCYASFPHEKILNESDDEEDVSSPIEQVIQIPTKGGPSVGMKEVLFGQTPLTSSEIPQRGEISHEWEIGRGGADSHHSGNECQDEEATIPASTSFPQLNNTSDIQNLNLNLQNLLSNSNSNATFLQLTKLLSQIKNQQQQAGFHLTGSTGGVNNHGVNNQSLNRQNLILTTNSQAQTNKGLALERTYNSRSLEHLSKDVQRPALDSHDKMFRRFAGVLCFALAVPNWTCFISGISLLGSKSKSSPGSNGISSRYQKRKNQIFSDDTSSKGFTTKSSVTPKSTASKNDRFSENDMEDNSFESKNVQKDDSSSQSLRNSSGKNSSTSGKTNSTTNPSSSISSEDTLSEEDSSIDPLFSLDHDFFHKKKDDFLLNKDRELHKKIDAWHRNPSALGGSSSEERDNRGDNESDDDSEADWEDNYAAHRNGGLNPQTPKGMTFKQQKARLEPLITTTAWQNMVGHFLVWGAVVLSSKSWNRAVTNRWGIGSFALFLLMSSYLAVRDT